MKGSRPEQAVLTRDTDMSKTDDTRAVIEGMVDGLNDHRIGDIGEFSFSDKVCIDEARLYMGEWAAAFGRQEATHSGEFLGIKATGKRIEIRYMDFWKVVDGKIVDNWVNVDFAHVAAQLGMDLFNGEGWEAYDRGDCTAPTPE